MEKQPLPELGDCSVQRTQRTADSVFISSTLSLLLAPPVGATEHNARGQGVEDSFWAQRRERRVENGSGEWFRRGVK